MKHQILYRCGSHTVMPDMNKEVDQDYEATRQRADEKMYQKKVEMKQSSGGAAPR